MVCMHLCKIYKSVEEPGINIYQILEHPFYNRKLVNEFTRCIQSETTLRNLGKPVSGHSELVNNRTMKDIDLPLQNTMA